MEREQLKSVVDVVRRIRHDANGPITVVIGHTQLLIDEEGRLDQDARESLEVVVSEMRRLMGILGGLEQVRDRLTALVSAPADPS